MNNYQCWILSYAAAVVTAVQSVSAWQGEHYMLAAMSAVVCVMSIGMALIEYNKMGLR